MNGVLIKGLSSNPSEINHITVMPCYDKKLEAVRTHNTFNEHQEVDSVLATHELLELFETKGIDFKEEIQK